MFEFLFGAKKRCVKVRRSKRDKRKKCKSKKCSVRSRRRSDLRKKCNPRRISKKVEALGGSPVEQAEAAAAVAADIAESNGASPQEVVNVATQTASETATSAGASPEEVSQAIVVAEENARGAIDYDSAMEYDDLNLEGLAFGMSKQGCSRCGSRRAHFGSECSVLPRTPEGCTRYNSNGTYPCYLTATGCRKRIDKQSRQLVYVVGQTRSSVVRQVLQEEVRSREIATQTPSSLDELEFGRTSGFGKCRPIYWIGVDGKIKTMKKCRNFCKKHRNNPHCNPEYARRIVSDSKGKSYFKNKVKKPSHSIRRMCRKLKIRCTKTLKGRRVYKSTFVLKKEIAKKKRKMKKRLR